MKPIAAAAIATVLIAIVVGAVVFYPPSSTGGTPTTTTSVTKSSTSSSFTSATSTSVTSTSSNGLELRLSLTSSQLPAGENLGVTVSEFNTRSTTNNVTKADLWGVQGLSLGACSTAGYGIFPFGIAIYQGSFSQGNIPAGNPIQFYAPVPCPLMLRLVTGYLFQPTSDDAVILPSSGSVIPVTPMTSNVTVSGDYSGGSLQPLSPGVYTVVAGDEWGALETVQFTVDGPVQGGNGTVAATISIGPTVPVCAANATTGPAPSYYSSLEAVVTTSSGTNMTFPVNWLSDGCEVTGTFQAALSPGAYTLNLSSCNYMGCRSSLPKAFSIVSGQTTDVSVSIDTGIR